MLKLRVKPLEISFIIIQSFGALNILCSEALCKFLLEGPEDIWYQIPATIRHICQPLPSFQGYGLKKEIIISAYIQAQSQYGKALKIAELLI